MKDKIESSEQSVIKLKRHMENGTCPPDLRYDAIANIFLDEDFKSDIKAVREEAEQKFLGAQPSHRPQPGTIAKSQIL